MELREFVADTLTQIAEGIADAQQRSAGRYRISPRHVPRVEDKQQHMEAPYDSLEKVDFDVLVSTSKKVSGEGGAKVFVVDASLTGEVEKESANRIKFHVFVEWPRLP